MSASEKPRVSKRIAAIAESATLAVDSKAKALKAEQEVNAKRIAAAAQAEADAIAAAQAEEAASTEEEAPAAEENNEEAQA